MTSGVRKRPGVTELDWRGTLGTSSKKGRDAQAWRKPSRRADHIIVESQPSNSQSIRSRFRSSSSSVAAWLSFITSRSSILHRAGDLASIPTVTIQMPSATSILKTPQSEVSASQSPPALQTRGIKAIIRARRRSGEDAAAEQTGQPQRETVRVHWSGEVFWSSWRSVKTKWPRSYLVAESKPSQSPWSIHIDADLARP